MARSTQAPSGVRSGRQPKSARRGPRKQGGSGTMTTLLFAFQALIVVAVLVGWLYAGVYMLKREGMNVADLTIIEGAGGLSGILHGAAPAVEVDGASMGVGVGGSGAEQARQQHQQHLRGAGGKTEPGAASNPPSIQSVPRGPPGLASTAGSDKWPLPPTSSSPSSSSSSPSSPPTRFRSFSTNANSYATLSRPMDHASLTVSAYVYIPRQSATKSINTIVSNKASGCEVTADRMGYSLYVNTYDTKDRQLILEWGNDQSGCAKLGSGQSGGVVEYDVWTHVAAVMTDNSASLYINGKQVASSRPITREIQHATGLAIGRHTDDKYPFIGKISSLVLISRGLDDDEVANLALTPLGDPFFAQDIDVMALPLADAPRNAKDSKQLKDVKGEAVGSYVWDAPSGPIEGLVNGIPDEARTEVTQEMRDESDALARGRREKVKGAMQRVWGAYREHAWGKDELKPISLTGHDPWGGIGCTLVDSLDTLWLMGMKEEFYEARDWVRDHLTFQKTGYVSMFETTIRELGGLLSAYDLSSDQAFLDKARDLGDRLLGAFNTPSGIPMSQVDLRTGDGGGGWSGGSSVLAELGTLQLEFRYLSEKTGDAKYAKKANHVFDLLSTKHVANGLYPIYISTQDGQPASSHVSFGALGDSFFEYLLKVWLQGGQQEPEYRRMFDESMDGVINVLLHHSRPSGLAYVTELEGGSHDHKMDHLACFLPAMLALGAVTLPHEDKERQEKYMQAAKGLTHTCYQMYHKNPTHLAPEVVRFQNGKELIPGPNWYILRPEAAEAMFYLHELTGHPIYREWSWEIFQAIEKHCRTARAYGAHPDVMDAKRKPDDRMESFFLAETLKYLYLIQDPDHTIDIRGKHVFNTEAHPLTMSTSPPGRKKSPTQVHKGPKAPPAVTQPEDAVAVQ